MSSNYTAQTLLHYMSKAREHRLKREFAKRQLEKHISHLKRTTPAGIRSQIEELEHKIKETVETSKGFVAARQNDELFHQRLRRKIKLLEHKLAQYEEGKTKKLQHAIKTEKRISAADRKALLKDIENSLKVVENVVKSMKDSGRYPAKVVNNIHAHVKGIKKRVERVKRRFFTA